MRLIGASVGILAALVVLLSWVEEPAQEARPPVVEPRQGSTAQGENGHPSGGDGSVAEAARGSASTGSQGALVDTAGSPRRTADPGVLEAPSAGEPGAELSEQPIPDKVAELDSGPETDPDPDPAKDSGMVSPPSPMEPMTGAQAPSLVAEHSPDSVPVAVPTNAPPSTGDLLAEAPVPAPGSLVESAPDADPGLDSSSTAQPETDPTLQWHLFMRPFGSAYKAEGFANHLSRTTGIPMTTVREGVGEYRVALGYHDATELQERITIIEASTGLDAKGDLR